MHSANLDDGRRRRHQIINAEMSVGQQEAQATVLDVDDGGEIVVANDLDGR